MSYDIQKAIDYSYKWAKKRNPKYYNFEAVGGNCTNFISQCLIAGGCTMNTKKETGWYYHSKNNRSPSWTSASYFYQFITTNKGKGPYGHVINMSEVKVGDILQFSFNWGSYTHTVLVVKTEPEILVNQNSNDYIERPLSDVGYKLIRALRIDGNRNK